MSKNKQSIKKAINDIKNDIYYQKLGAILTRLRSWLLQKDTITKQYIIQNSHIIVGNNFCIHDKLTNFSNVFVQFIEEIGDSLASYDTQGSNKKNRSDKKLKSNSCEKQNYFEKCKQTWHSRKEGMKKIKKFSQIVVVNIKKQTVENNKLLSQLDSCIRKIRPSIQKSSSQYLKKVQIASINKNQKQFEFNKIKEISQTFSEQFIQYQQFIDKFLSINRRFHERESYLMQAIHSNISTLNQIMNNCFKGFQNYMVQEYRVFEEKIKEMIHQVEKCMDNNEKGIKINMNTLRQALQDISKQLFQQISIASWTISSKTAEQKIFESKKGVLTLDNKFLVLKQDQKQVQSEINLMDATINQTEVIGQLVLKPKKKSSISSKIVIKFQKPQNQDQFRLHLKRAKQQI